MPYETAVTPFTGDSNIADFMENVWLPFARDDCKWADNQAPSPNGIGTNRNYVWTHRIDRGGSPVATLSPYTTKPPYVFFRTYDNHMAMCTGTGIDVATEWHDQPGNPGNWWKPSAIIDDGSGTSYFGTSDMMTCWINDIIGTFSKYWLFSDDAGSYVHCVVQTRSREFRHFHVGLLTPLHPEVSADSFYVTGHYWDSLYSRFTADTNETDNQNEHNPYSGYHRIPFRTKNPGTTPFFLPLSEYTSMWIYMPGLNANWDWYLPSNQNTDEVRNGDPQQGPTKSTGASISPNPGSPRFVYKYEDAWPANTWGVAQVSGYSHSLGKTLFNADKTYTSNTNSLIPIYVSAGFNFAGVDRQGVVAQVPDVYRINMRDYSPGQEITVGSDTYVVFPVINKDNANILDGEGYSGFEGWAYKKVNNGPVA